MNLSLGVVLVLGVMILVHEAGHFVVARLCGVRVDVFSIGFGPRLFGWKRGATDYRVSAVPLGGYVRMAGQDLSDVDRGKTAAPSGKPDELLSKTRWQRAIIAFAGPAVNLILPVVLLTAFFIVKGQPYPAYLDKPVQVLWPATGSPLQAGDRVVAINGVNDPTWEKAEAAASTAGPGDTWHLTVENQGARRSVDVPVKDAAQAMRVFGYPPIPPTIDEVVAGMPAYRAGLQPGDEIVALNGQRIGTWPQFVDLVKASGGKPLQVRVRRKDQETDVQLTPQQMADDRGETVWMVGIQRRLQMDYRSVGAGQAIQFAVLDTVAGIDQVVNIVGRLFTGRVSVRQLQGVVGIARESGQAVRQGPSSVINLMALISVNLGILNLLPIPILDGGHILLLAIEGAMRRDLSLAFKERFVQVGFVFLLVLFGIVMYNDVVRILPVR